MAKLEPKEISLSEINNGNEYENGDIVDASSINSAIEASAYAQGKANQALERAISAGTSVKVDGTAQTVLNFTSDPQEQIDTKATKSTTSGTLNYRGISTGAYVKLGSVTIPKSGTLLMNVAQANYSGNRLGLKASIASGGVAGNANFAESINTDTSSNPNLAVSIQGTVTAGAVVDIYGKVTTNSSGMVAYYTYTIID